MPLTMIDVCMGLGLCVVRVDVKFDLNKSGFVGLLFSGEAITINGITKMTKGIIGIVEWYR